MPSEKYNKDRERHRVIAAGQSKAGRDISPLPAVGDPDSRAKGRASFEFFARVYLPATFSLPWSVDHRKAIGLIEQVGTTGGQYAYAMPRGSGKTSLAEAAAIWSLLYGHRRFAVLIGSDESSAASMLESIKTELETNDLLARDFPEACHPVRSLGGIAHRCKGQLFDGERTHIEWTANRMVLATIPGAACSGAIISVAGLTGRIRGMKHKGPNGDNLRPDLVILDDPQTDESAKSESQVANREKIISGAVLGLGGPGKKIAALMPCTVIAKDDLADRLLDRAKHPEWQGERTKMVYSFPTEEKLWAEYTRIRSDSMRAGNGGREATEFYRANREQMDAGSAVAWPCRFNPDEISAIQHAMNLRLADEGAFFAEYQNEPLVAKSDDQILTADQIIEKVNRCPRGKVPTGVEKLTAFVDVQGKLLWWAVCGWESDFTGYVIDYEAFPEQNRRRFTLSDARNTLQRHKPGAGQEGAIYAGLEGICAKLIGRQWERQDGATMRIDRLLIDANWGESTEVVYKFCQQSKYGSVVMPAHGKGIGASAAPWENYTRKPGETLGHHWMIPSVKGKRTMRHVLTDTNYWKSFLHARLAVPMGDRGTITLYGDRPDDHRLFAEHLTAEYGVRTSGRGRELTEWRLRPHRPDNHWFDCMVGCAAAAAMCGCRLLEAKTTVAVKKIKRRKVAYL